MNLNKKKGNQPDYTGILRYIDDTGAEHKIFLSTWVYKTGRGGSILSLKAQSYNAYKAVCAKFEKQNEKEARADMQALRKKRLEREKLRSLAPPEGTVGLDCDCKYFDTEDERIDDGRDAKDKEVPEVHDNATT